MRKPLLAHVERCARAERGRAQRDAGGGLDGVSHANARDEPFVVNREVPAVIVPAGVEVKLNGQAGYITQALRQLSVLHRGNSSGCARTRIAIGKEGPGTRAAPMRRDDVRTGLGADADLFDRRSDNIVDLGSL